jgi:hypothetical protein
MRRFPYAAKEERKQPGRTHPVQRRKTGKEVDPMIEFDLNSLWLIPVTLAEAFMLWALWNFWKGARRR